MHVGGCSARKVETRAAARWSLSIRRPGKHATQDARDCTMDRPVYSVPHLVHLLLLAVLAANAPCAGSRASSSAIPKPETRLDTGPAGHARLPAGPTTVPRHPARNVLDLLPQGHSLVQPTAPSHSARTPRGPQRGHAPWSQGYRGVPVVPWSPSYWALSWPHKPSPFAPLRRPLTHPVARKPQRRHVSRSLVPDPLTIHHGQQTVPMFERPPGHYPALRLAHRHSAGYPPWQIHRKGYNVFRAHSTVSPATARFGMENEFVKQTYDIGTDDSFFYDRGAIAHRPRMALYGPRGPRPAGHGGLSRKQKPAKHGSRRRNNRRKARGPKRNRKHKQALRYPNKDRLGEYRYEFFTHPHAPGGVEEDVTVTVPTEAIRPLLTSKNVAFSGERAAPGGGAPTSGTMTLAPGVHVVKLLVRETDQKNSTVIMTLRALPDLDGPLKKSQSGEEEPGQDTTEGPTTERPVHRIKRSYRSINHRIRTQMLAHRLSISYRHVQPCDYADRFYCMNGGTCVFVGALDIKTCRCPIGYTGVRCELIDQEYILSLLTNSIIFS